MSDISEIESRATEVTFYEDRARVIRRATIDAEPGFNHVRIRGATVLIDDASLSADLSDSDESSRSRLLTTRVRRNVRRVQDATDAEVEELLERRREAGRQLDTVQRKIARLEQREGRLLDVETGLFEDVQSVPADKITGEAWESALRQLDEQLEHLDEVRAGAREEMVDLRRRFERVKMLYNRALTVRPEVAATVEVQFEVEEAGEVEIELCYYTPCALWRPSHVARLERGDDARITVETYGTVWQHTGEIWDGVHCRFSTARPTRAASPPLLTDDVLRSRTKAPEERKTVHVEARDVDIATTGAEGGRAVSEMPGVDDGGEPLTLDAVDVVSIPSNGEPFRVKVGEVELPATVDLVAYPERSTVPYIRARGTWQADYPLLAGPIAVMREREFAGRSLAEFASPGEAVELGFGIDSGLSVQRKVEDKSKTTKITGKNRLNRTVKLFVSNLEGEQRRLKVIERIPVSEIADVEIDAIEGASPDENGLAEKELSLAPKETLTYEISYRVQYGNNVKLRW